MTDNEIIKAMECCQRGMGIRCEKCPLCRTNDCMTKLYVNTLDLITRQQAELERLKKTEIEIDNFCRRLCRIRMLNGNAIASYEDLQNYIQQEKSEAVKEFAERVKEFMHNKFKALAEYEFEYITERDIDNLVKELSEDGKSNE